MTQTFRYSSPGMVVGKQAMTPLRTHSKVDLGGLKRGLGSNMGAFFSNKDAGQWSQDLRQRDEDLGRTPGAQQRRIQELNIVDQQNVERYSHQKRLKEEHERHAGGYGKLGAKDDRLSVRNSAFGGCSRRSRTTPTRSCATTRSTATTRMSLS